MAWGFMAITPPLPVTPYKGPCPGVCQKRERERESYS